MRIPLDYYRILGVPIQADREQLAQAYGDRSSQLPRCEYSQKAIAARKQLLEEAYSILSQPVERSQYNLKFLERTYEITEAHNGDAPLGDLEASIFDDRTPWIEIAPELFVGALVILQELGEYELVLRLGEPYARGLEKDRRGIRSDIILTLALSYLELGREQWQQDRYQKAANSGQMGLDLLLREQLFPSIREEIQIDLCKLRPYLILELLSRENSPPDSRNKGKKLLQEMLEARGGIEGFKDDRSGLSIDDFLRFIQQLRTHLSASEQQELFEAEAKRPSAVAAYLAVYALLARGFANKKSDLIFRARSILMGLEQRQEVYLEQAVTYLLLGKTELATYALEQSQELEAKAFIREHSDGAPDLLPGLCLYAQRWLSTEVFSHFCDLAEVQISLEEYFADRQVQAYLEQLSDETISSSNDTDSIAEKPTTNEAAKPQPEPKFASKNPAKQLKLAYENIRSRLSQKTPQVVAAATTPTTPVTKPVKKIAKRTSEIKFSPITFSPLTDLVASPQASFPIDSSAGSSTSKSAKMTPAASRISRKKSSKNTAKTMSSWRKIVANFNANNANSRKNRYRKSGLKIHRVLGLAMPLFLGLGLLAFSYQRSQIDGSSISISEDLPGETLDTAPENSEVVFSQPTINKETAKEVIQSWLASKSKAFGSDREIDQLNNILAEPVLTRQRNSAEFFQSNNAHRIYSHSVEVRSARVSEQNTDLATVEARVKEVASHYQNDRYDRALSYDDDLLVRYHLVRQDDRWLIKDINVLK